VISSVKNKVYAKTKLAQNENGRIITMKKEKNFTKIYKSLLASAACIAMMFGCFFGYYSLFEQPSTEPVKTTEGNTEINTVVKFDNQTISTTVTLEVNPGIEIKADEEEKVLEVFALNKDGEIIIGNMNFEGEKLEKTVNTLIGTMIDSGYINETTNSVLLSVDNKNENIGNTLKDKLSAGISDLINVESIGGAVISQTVSGDDKELAELASTYGITVGKAKLIQTIMKINDEREFSDYVELTITELNKIMTSSADNPKDENTYIGEEKALEIALSELNLTISDLTTEPVIELVVSRGAVCYQISVYREWQDNNGTHSALNVIYVDAFSEKKPVGDVTEPALSAEEAWECVLNNLGNKAPKAELTMQRFNDYESALPMTYNLAFELDGKNYVALVDAMDGTVIRIVEM
jgi:uncharacterized membrane protein YkoI